jgi:hypothetical protein
MGDLAYGSKAYSERLEHWFSVINLKLDGASKVESRLMGLDVMPRMMVALENNASQCDVCQAFHNQLEVLIDGLPSIVAGNNVQGKKTLEGLGKDVMLHFKTTHGMYPRGKQKANFSLWAMLGGMVLGALLGLAGLLTSLGGGLVLGWLVGTTVGVVGGSIVEGRLREKHLLF